MLNILQNNFDISLIRNKGRIISIKISKTIPNPLFRDKEKVISLTFFDSYQLLPSSLRKLGLSFNTSQKKDIFPYNFVNKDNLNYVGPVPSMEFFPLDTFSSVTEQAYGQIVMHIITFHLMTGILKKKVLNLVN